MFFNMEDTNKYFFQFDTVNGFAIRVESTSFSRAILAYVKEYGPNAMCLVKQISNIDRCINPNVKR